MDEPHIRFLGPDDADLMDDAHPDAFDHPLDPAHVAAMLAAPHQHFAVALVDARVVGMATAVHYHRPDKPADLYVDEVSVADAYQRRGLGGALVRAMVEQGEALGCGSVWLLTEADNAPARALYRHVGGTEEQRPVYVTFPAASRHRTGSQSRA